VTPILVHRVIARLNTGGPAELLEDGDLGRLVWTDSPRDFAGALEAVLGAPGDPSERALARVPVLARFSIERLVDDVERLYAAALARAGVPLP
jgi:glycosyltransferase involved in cell wall biosynthesis